MAITLDYTKPVTTYNNRDVHIYHVYEDYMNGAWYKEDEHMWIPCQWTLTGYRLPTRPYPHWIEELDLVNINV